MRRHDRPALRVSRWSRLHKDQGKITEWSYFRALCDADVSDGSMKPEGRRR